MLDLRSIREDPERARAALARRGAADALDELLRLDERRRELLPQVEERRARQNRASDEIAAAKREGDDAEPLIAEMREVSASLKKLETELTEVEAARDELAATLPNLPDPEAPEGETEDDAVPLREVGKRPSFDCEPRDHLELGLANGWIEMEKAAEASGSRFAYLLGDLAMLELALVRFALELLRDEGFTPTIPPFLVGTSEVSLAALHAGEILASDDLPIRYVGFSTCFRRESGAGGKDTRGIFRVHQFDKVEMFSFVRPDESRAEHERLLALEERILQALEIPYRVVDIPTGDLGASAARKFDCEAWFPSQDRYREVTSCSNTTDYQARRLDCRFRPEPDASPIHVHTLNGTAVAGRALIALLENHQQADGSVAVPDALREASAPEKIGGG